MKKLLLLPSLFALIACDDGDIITTDFDFEDTSVRACTPISSGNSSNYIFYKNSSANNEALLLSFNSNQNIFEENFEGNFALSTSNIFEYRRFNAPASEDYFCGFIPPTVPEVQEIFNGTSGTISVNTIRIDDDEDGIPTELEMENGLEIDTDGDGIPNHLDLDDDGDNVPTSEEGVVVIDGVVSIRESLDTDEDGLLNYLDKDDDGDDVDTKQESIDGDNDPTNDSVDGTTLKNYLNPNVSLSAQPLIEERIQHFYFTVLEVDFKVNNLNFSDGREIFVYDTFDFGQIRVFRERVDLD